MKLRPVTALRAFLLAHYALASALIGAAHKPQFVPAPIDLAAFALPDGTIPVICWSPSKGAGQKGAHKGVCDACRLIGAPGLPAPCESNPSVLANPGERIAHQYISSVGPAANLASLGARGPPTV